MPKRPNPFGDASPLQFKSHIAQRDVDLGVNKAQNMETVYEKTKSLLFDGSRRNNTSYCASPPVSPECMNRDTLPSKPLPGQMTLDSCGTLFSCQVACATPPTDQHMDTQEDAAVAVHPPSLMVCNNNNNSMPNRLSPAVQMHIDTTGKLCRENNTAPPTVIPNSRCHTCGNPQDHQQLQSIHTRPCNFCDKPSCSRCLRQCVFCASVVCLLCSSVNYEQAVERIFCIQCAS